MKLQGIGLLSGFICLLMCLPAFVHVSVVVAAVAVVVVLRVFYLHILEKVSLLK